jgi:hypothetical protein
MDFPREPVELPRTFRLMSITHEGELVRAARLAAFDARHS